MHSFSDFSIKADHGRFIGTKVKMYNILNKEIIVHDFKVKESKFSDNGTNDCLHLQIEIDNQKRVLFSGSKVLIDMIQKVPRENLPFKTTIVKEGESFQFT